METLTAFGDHIRVRDFNERLLEADERIRRAVKQPAERRALHVSKLKRAVREETLGRVTHTPSFFFRISFTTAGFALPPVAFMV